VGLVTQYGAHLLFRKPDREPGNVLIPATIMGLHMTGATMRMTRTMMLEVLRQDYIRTAWPRAGGEGNYLKACLEERPNPVITIMGTQLSILIGGTVVIEQIFALPGLGRLMLESLNQRDYPMISGVNLFIAVFVLFINLMVDLTYGWLDPRVHYR